MRPEKESIVNEVRDNLDRNAYVLLVDSKGLSVTATSNLRDELREVDARMQVVKNTFFALAARDLGWGDISSIAHGPSAMVFGSGEVSETAKKLKSFSSRNEQLLFKGGRLGERLLTAADVEAIASIPSGDILLGQAVGTIAAPMRQLAGVMQQKVASLLYVLRSAADKKAGAQ